MDAKTIGSTIKSLRLAAGRTQIFVAEQCNISKSYLSKIEKGSFLPSLAVLDKIAAALGVTVSRLLSKEDSFDVIVEKREDVIANAIDTARKYKVFPYALNCTSKKMQPFYFYGRRDSHVQKKNSHASQEFMYIISGECFVEINDQKYHLEQGDSIYFDSNIEHQTIIISEELEVLNIFVDDKLKFDESGVVVNTHHI